MRGAVRRRSSVCVKGTRSDSQINEKTWYTSKAPDKTQHVCLCLAPPAEGRDATAPGSWAQERRAGRGHLHRQDPDGASRWRHRRHPTGVQVCNLYTKLTSTLVLWMCCFSRAERHLFITVPGWETPLFFRRCSVTYPPTSSRPPSTNTPRYKSAVNVRSASHLRQISDWSDASVKVRSHQTRMTRIARLIYMLSQCKDAIDNPAALFARMRRRELSIFLRAIRTSC